MLSDEVESGANVTLRIDVTEPRLPKGARRREAADVEVDCGLDMWCADVGVRVSLLRALHEFTEEIIAKVARLRPIIMGAACTMSVAVLVSRFPSHLPIASAACVLRAFATRRAFRALASNSSASMPALEVPYRKTERFFVVPQPAQITVVFIVEFEDVMDRCLARIIAQVCVSLRGVRVPCVREV